jgi:hypothetical protein
MSVHVILCRCFVEQFCRSLVPSVWNHVSNFEQPRSPASCRTAAWSCCRTRVEGLLRFQMMSSSTIFWYLTPFQMSVAM